MKTKEEIKIKIYDLFYRINSIKYPDEILSDEFKEALLEHKKLNAQVDALQWAIGTNENL